jgi:hypothetical protein
MVSWRSISTSCRTLTPWGQCWVQESQPRQRQMLGSAARRSTSPTWAIRIIRAGGMGMAPAFGQPELQRWHW